MKNSKCIRCPHEDTNKCHSCNIEKKQKVHDTLDERPRKTVDNNWTNKVPVGFCYNRIHKGYVTLKQMKSHRCNRKKCPYFKRLTHEYWNKKERNKQLKKCKKLYLKG